MERRQKTFQYRCIEGLPSGKKMSATLIDVLFNTHKKVGQRSEPVTGANDTEQVRRCINHKERSGTMLFGELILYVKGTNKQVVTVNEDLEELPTEQIRAPKSEGGNPREFVEGSVYFGILDNHMVLVQSAALRDRDLENHLNWLLRDCAGQLQNTEFAVLRRELSMEAKKKMPNVKAVQIGAPLMYKDVKPEDAQLTKDGRAQTSFTFTDLGRTLLDAIVGVEQLKKLNLEQYGGAEELEVSLTIRRKGGSRKPDSPGEQTISALTTHLRHTHEQDIRVVGKSGRLSGDTLFLEERLGVECQNGVPKRHSLFETMRQWLIKKMEDGSVQP